MMHHFAEKREKTNGDFRTTSAYLTYTCRIQLKILTYLFIEEIYYFLNLGFNPTYIQIFSITRIIENFSGRRFQCQIINRIKTTFNPRVLMKF
jgi:hypothetical protein